MSPGPEGLGLERQTRDMGSAPRGEEVPKEKTPPDKGNLGYFWREGPIRGQDRSLSSQLVGNEPE